MFKLCGLATVVLTATVLGGCAQSSLTGDNYSRSEARAVQTVQHGVIESVRPVVIDGRTDGVAGTGGGALLGGLAGSTVGGGRGSDLMAVVGAIAGGILGSHVEENVTREQGQELTVRLDSGRTISVVQGVENGQFMRQGDRVRVLTNRGTTRVTY